MKKKVGSKVFVQNYDISFISNELLAVPAIIMTSLFEDNGFFIISGPGDAKRFEHFYEGEAADWIMSQDWLVNFDDYCDMSPYQINREIKEKQAEYKLHVIRFNSMDEQYRAEHFSEENEAASKYAHRIASLDLMSKFIRGLENFGVPV